MSKATVSQQALYLVDMQDVNLAKNTLLSLAVKVYTNKNLTMLS